MGIDWLTVAAQILNFLVLRMARGFGREGEE